MAIPTFDTKIGSVFQKTREIDYAACTDCIDSHTGSTYTSLGWSLKTDLWNLWVRSKLRAFSE